ncbi:hypothetical protein EDC04DRAFT_2815738, partial [Pisolithus marmoratus]
MLAVFAATFALFSYIGQHCHSLTTVPIPMPLSTCINRTYLSPLFSSPTCKRYPHFAKDWALAPVYFRKNTGSNLL